MTVSAELLVKLTAVQTGQNDQGNPEFRPSLTYLKQLADGTGANQADRIWTDTRTLAASGSEDLDLAGVLADAFGSAITMAEVVALLIEASASNTNNVVVGDAAAPVPLFGGTNPTLSIKPGGLFLVVAPDASGQFAVGAGSTDDLKIANSGSGTPVTYTIMIIGRSA